MNKFSLTLFLILIIGLSSCVDRTFDEPDFDFEDPNLEATMSIASLRASHVNGQYEVQAGGDIISGVVIANDKSGNFYETIVIADETAGIEIKIEKRSLFNTFPVGRRVFVKLDGLVLGDYNELIQIGYSSGDNGFIGIPGEYIDDYVLGGSINNPIQVDTLTVSQLNNNYFSMLVTLKDVQFADSELGKTYADGLYKQTENRTLVSCTGEEILIRTSGYASFANNELPQGKGTITAVLSNYRETLQLFLRDTTDIHFDDMRCGAGSGNESQIDIIDLRNAYNSGSTGIGDELKIRAVVVSARAHNNIYQNNVVVQDATGGLVLRFGDAHDLDPGDEIEAIVSGMQLSDYNGLLQINNLPLGSVAKVGTTTPSVRQATVVDVLNNAEAWESTLVQITDVSLLGGNVYSDEIYAEDETATIRLYTRSQADFAGEDVPTNKVDITAIVGDFNGPQLNLRSIDDVAGGTVGPCTPTFNKDFEDMDIYSGCWTTQVVAGESEWSTYEFSGERFARISNYNSSTQQNTESDSWLISAPVDLNAFNVPALSFRTACNYDGQELEVYVSTSYDGESVPDLAEWTRLTVPVSDGDWVWVPSGKIDLSAYKTSEAYVAFRYLGSDSDGKTWEVDDVVLSEKQGGSSSVVFEDGFDSGLNAWTAYNVLGAQVWEHSTKYGNPDDCARVSGYDGSAFANEDWLISPAIELGSASSATLTFETAMNYTGPTLEVYLSSDYDGAGDPNNFEWEKITPILSSGGWTWTGSGTIDLGEYLGADMYFAFKFTSTDQESATWEVDNVEVTVVD
jgi:hypothetical protein